MVLRIVCEIMRMDPAEARQLFEAYADYTGRPLEKFIGTDLEVWYCDDCDVKVPVVASDPQAYGPVLCPDCGQILDVKNLRQIEVGK